MYCRAIWSLYYVSNFPSWLLYTQNKNLRLQRQNNSEPRVIESDSPITYLRVVSHASTFLPVISDKIGTYYNTPKVFDRDQSKPIIPCSSPITSLGIRTSPTLDQWNGPWRRGSKYRGSFGANLWLWPSFLLRTLVWGCDVWTCGSYFISMR